MIRIIPFDRIRIFSRHLTIFCVEGIHPAANAIPEADSDDLILAGTTDYKHPAIIDMLTKQMAIASKGSNLDAPILAFHPSKNSFEVDRMQFDDKLKQKDPGSALSERFLGLNNLTKKNDT